MERENEKFGSTVESGDGNVDISSVITFDAVLREKESLKN